ncbi:hypothetical protein [Nocardioides montaniterrae]
MSNWGPQTTNIDNRAWYKKPIGIAGIIGGIVVVGGIAAASGGGGGSDSGSSAPHTPAASSHGHGKSPSAAATSSAPAPKATWKTVAKLKGSTDGSGPDFHLNGCDTRMKYSVNGGSSVVVAFYVMDSGKQLMKDGGFPVASPTKSGAGETSLHEDAGDYYLNVVAANASWSAKVQEKC